MDPVLKVEVGDSLKVDHPDVFDTFFRQMPKLHEMTTAVLQRCQAREPPLFQENKGWTEWPETCEEAAVLNFLNSHVNHFLRYANDHGFRPTEHRHCVMDPNKPLIGSLGKRKLDIGLVQKPSSELEKSDKQNYKWSNILIPGELKSNPREDKHNSTWLDLVRYAREIFSAQDTRRFILGFTLCGSIMRLWVFDRLGVVGSTSFDLNEDGKMFVSVILGYLWMSEEELGYDPTITREGRRCTSIQRDGRIESVCLEDLIKQQHSVVGRATRCWQGFAEDTPERLLVIKDSWEYEERLEEGLLLKEATEAGVKNVARYYYHETVRIGGRVDDVLDNVRKGLSDTAGRNPFQQLAIRTESVTSSTTSGARRGRSRNSSRTTTRKRSSSGTQASMPPPKRPCLDSPDEQDTYRRRNRVHRRLIVQDFGKSIYNARSPRGILTGLLGGIKGVRHTKLCGPWLIF